jgi:RNA polymerase sigma-70 factor (ECF subfamily)
MEAENIETLYKAHAPVILLYLRRLVGTGDMAADLLQETFATALSSEKNLRKAASARGWLFGVARNLGLNAIRRKKVLSPLDIDPPAADAQEDERLEQMWKAIGGLPDVLRETLRLKLQQELSYEEIATVLSIPVGTVRSRLHHAVRRLRERMQESKA